MHYWGWGWWWWGWMWFWVIIAIIVILLLSGRGGRRWREYRDPAEDIVRQRYARGEISKEEFDRLLQDLRSH